MDRRREPIRGDEHRGCWEARPTAPVPSAARHFRDRRDTGDLVAVATVDVGLWAEREP